VFAVAHTVHPSETSALVPHANNVVILGWIDIVASLHGAAAGAPAADGPWPELTIVGSSPEPMVQLLDRTVVSRPIAGTRR
jgi:hypothetical protein